MKSVFNREANELLLERVVESVPIRVFWKDRDSRYLGCNSLFAKDAGCDHPDKLIGKTDFDLPWRDQAELYRADDQKVMDAGISITDLIEPQTTLDGQTIWLRTSKVPLRDPAGKVTGILGIYDDITERKLAEEQQRETDERYHQIHDKTSDIIYFVNTDGTIDSLNPAFERLTGWKAEDWVGKPFSGILHEDDLAKAFDSFKQTLSGVAVTSLILRIKTKAGDYLGVDANATLLDDKLIMGIARDVRVRLLAEEEVYRLATIDGLTGLLNRRAFTEVLQREIEQTARYEQPLCLAMYDLDHFKRVNDSFGHDVGDKVLQTVSTIVSAHIRNTDICARWGGEEFMVLMPHTPLDVARQVMERLRDLTAEHRHVPAGQVTVSFGLTQLQSGEELEVLLKRVDDALYKAKNTGRNRVEAL
ncbi:MAG: diguanylate cyclase [Pseudohongiellaceae bacterium]